MAGELRMMLRLPSIPQALLRAFILPITTFCISSLALAEEQEIYVFERMWPTLKQPWYFQGLGDVAIDNAGNVYVAEFF